MSASAFASFRPLNPVKGAAMIPSSNHGSLVQSTSLLKLEDLEWDKDDEDSFEVPDFHFDWGVVKEKPGHKAARGDTRSEALHESRDAASIDTTRTQTPPSHPRTSTGSSAHSSRVSASHSSLSLVRTSPETDSDVRHEISGRLRSTSSTGESGGQSSGGSSRIYGGRAFSRVVSAPLDQDHARLEEGHAHSRLDASINHHTKIEGHSSLSSDTATIRTAWAPADPSHSGIEESYTTPAVVSRTISKGSSSTARRVAGLSRFGGPARRVPLAQEADDLETDSAGAGKVLIGSPGASSSLVNSPDSGSRNSHPEMQHIRYRSSPPPLGRSFVPTIHEESPELPRSGHQAAGVMQRASPILRDSPAPSFGEQENTHEPREGGKLWRYRTQDRDIQQPLQPAHSVLSAASYPAASKGPSGIQITAEQLRPAPPPPRPETHFDHDRRADQDYTGQPAPPPGTKKAFMVNGAAYEKIGLLGRGATSRVYSVLCSTKRTIHALKRVSLEKADAETIQSYTNEIELLRRLRGHDRVIQLLDHQIIFGQNNRPKTLQMIMECGESDFADLLEEQRGKPVNMNFVGLYWEQMLEAVQAVHQENVVHTDLKPANFVLVKGRLKIIDFGIAKAVANDTVNIQRDQQIGTANYMSPEAIQRMNNQKVLKLSYPSDVWSLGCILYQMIYGNPPFHHIGVGPLAKMTAIANPNHEIEYPDETKPQSTTSSGISVVSVEAVRISHSAIDTMRRCLAYKKEDRLTIPQLLRHPFLRPHTHSLPPNATSITSGQMRVLVNWVLKERGLSELPEGDRTAEELFDQLRSQNSLPAAEKI